MVERNSEQVDLVDMWSVCGRYVVDMWSVCGRYVVDMWSVCGPYVVHMRSICQWLVSGQFNLFAITVVDSTVVGFSCVQLP